MFITLILNLLGKTTFLWVGYISAFLPPQYDEEVSTKVGQDHSLALNSYVAVLISSLFCLLTKLQNILQTL